MSRKSKCYVLGCNNYLAFSFPKASRQAWLDAIGRPNDNPKSCHGLCADHFNQDDFMPIRGGNDTTLVRKRLRTAVVPSRNIPPESLSKRPKMTLKELQNSSHRADDSSDDSEDDLGVSVLPSDDIQQIPFEDSISSILCDELILPENEAENGANDVQNDSQVPEIDSDVIIDHSTFGELDCGSEVIISQESDVIDRNADSVGVATGDDANKVKDSESVCDKGKGAAADELPDNRTSKNPKQKYDIHDYKDRPEGVKYYTGLETDLKFMFVFQSLRIDLFPITYRYTQVKVLSLENQYFMTLWKLRRNTPDFELGDHFGVSRTTVSNVCISMVSFMAEQWGKIDVWLSRSLTDYYMPDSFKKAYPTTRGIIDGTDCYIAKPSNPRMQQATWSTYKNANTVKVLVTANPCGLISDTTPAFGGATSDRQIVERSSLISKCQRGDSLMADRGFNVQDMFAPKGIAINIPAYLKGKDHLSGATLMKDRKLARERVHIERLIGPKHIKYYPKSYSHYVPISSEIFFVCAMLCNFMENIVRKPK